MMDNVEKEDVVAWRSAFVDALEAVGQADRTAAELVP